MSIDWHKESLRRLTEEELDDVIEDWPKWSELQAAAGMESARPLLLTRVWRFVTRRAA